MRTLLEVIYEAIQDNDSKVKDRVEDVKISTLRDNIKKYFPDILNKVSVVKSKAGVTCLVGSCGPFNHPQRDLKFKLDELTTDMEKTGSFNGTFNDSFLQLCMNFHYHDDEVICNLIFSRNTKMLMLNVYCHDDEKKLDKINDILHQK